MIIKVRRFQLKADCTFRAVFSTTAATHTLVMEMNFSARHRNRIYYTFLNTDAAAFAFIFINLDLKPFEPAVLHFSPVRRNIVNDLTAEAAAVTTETNAEQTAIVRHSKNKIINPGFSCKAWQACINAFAGLFLKNDISIHNLVEFVEGADDREQLRLNAP